MGCLRAAFLPAAAAGYFDPLAVALLWLLQEEEEEEEEVDLTRNSGVRSVFPPALVLLHHICLESWHPEEWCQIAPVVGASTNQPLGASMG